MDSYWSNGAQINYPIDTYIADLINQNLEPWPKAWSEPDWYTVGELYKLMMKEYCQTVRDFTVRFTCNCHFQWYSS
jgi:phosphoglucomutase